MRRQCVPEITDAFLFCALCLGLLGLGTCAAALAHDHAALVSATSIRVAGPPSYRTLGNSLASDAACRCKAPSPRRGRVELSVDPLRALPDRVSGNAGPAERQSAPWDGRIYLLQTASAARMRPWALMGTAATDTQIWLNDPASIGSTSPPAMTVDANTIEIARIAEGPGSAN